ncbi:hypothetical protein D3C74_370430 [compost metagenome]
MTKYSFRTYSDIAFSFNNGLSLSPAGSHVAKDGITRSNTYFYDAKSSIDSLENNVRDFDVAAALFAFEAAVTFFSLSTIIGAIAAGGATAFSAIQAYNAWSDCKDDISDAYTYVSML